MLRRPAYFAGIGQVDAAILRLEAIAPGAPIAGPAIVESSFTTVVLDPGASAERAPSGSLVDPARRPSSRRARAALATEAVG